MTATIAHCVTPYLFLTGSWIHAQLAAARRHRPVVLTQATENLDLFPFAPVHDLSPRGPAASLGFRISKYLLGRFPAGPYLRVLREERAALLHAHQGWEGARIAHVAAQLPLPIVVSFYGRDATLLPRHPYWRRLYARMFPRIDRAVAEGGHMAQTLLAIGARPEQVRVVHLGIPVETYTFRERRPAEDGPILGLIAASFREKKGIVYAIEALGLLRDRFPRLHLRIVGDGPLRSVLESQIAALGLGGRIELLGYRSPADYREELLRADFLLAPSVVAADGDSEGGAPVCLLEAQASGLPIVSTTHCDIPEATVPDGSALLAPERDARTLAARIEELLERPDRWAEMGRVGRAHVQKEYDIRTQAERIADVYDDLLRRGGSERARPEGSL